MNKGHTASIMALESPPTFKVIPKFPTTPDIATFFYKNVCVLLYFNWKQNMPRHNVFRVEKWGTKDIKINF